MTRMPNICPGCGSKRTEALQRRIDGEDFDCPVCFENYQIETSDVEAVGRRGRAALASIKKSIRSGKII